MPFLFGQHGVEVNRLKVSSHCPACEGRGGGGGGTFGHQCLIMTTLHEPFNVKWFIEDESVIRAYLGTVMKVKNTSYSAK